MISKPPLNTPSNDIKTMRPPKYPKLGTMSMRRIPNVLHSELESLFTQLDRLAVRQDPCEFLSKLSDKLSEEEV